MRNTHPCKHPFSELLIAADAGSLVLHQLHPPQYHIDTGRGLCQFVPCKALFEAIYKASAEPCPRCKAPTP